MSVLRHAAGKPPPGLEEIELFPNFFSAKLETEMWFVPKSQLSRIQMSHFAPF